ncbi:MAG: ABC transporter ATP-binding protein [Bacteroidia bacterium]|nr:ABC transporter ATP-binding protein [Bacteroidia bacterium]
MIQITGLHKSYKNNKALRGVDLEFSQSGIVAVLGPNGSGKTTLMKCILGLTLFKEGNIYVDDTDIQGQFEYRKLISHLPQVASFPENLTPDELIRMIKDLRPGVTNEKKFIKLFELGAEMHKKMSALSGGNKQKVNLLLSLMYDNPILILDEPTSGLDPLAIINLKSYLKDEKKKGKMILVTTHIMSFAEELADHVVFLLDGKIYFDGSMQSLMLKQQSDSLEMAIATILKANIPALKTIKSSAV